MPTSTELSQKRKLLFLINPISGTRNKQLLFEEISTEMRKVNLLFEVANTKASGNYSSVKTKIEKEKFTDVVVCGGDGSISHVAAAIGGLPVNVGVVPMGSGNGLALAAKIPVNVRQALKVVREGSAAAVDAFTVNGKYGCMLAGLGFDAQVAEDFSKHGGRGPVNYAKLTARNFFSARTYPFVLEVEHKKIATEAFFISVANSNQFGNHLTIAPKAILNDGLLDVVVATKMGKAKLLFTLTKQIRSGKVKNVPDGGGSSGILYFQTDRLSICNPAKAPLHIDGDPTGTAEKLMFEVMPGAFKLLQPAARKPPLP